MARVIGEEFGAVSPRLLGSLDVAAGFEPAKAQRVAREHQDQQIAAWLEGDWPRIKKEPLAATRPWGLLDDSGVKLALLLTRTWALRGHTPVFAEQQGERQEVSIAGALWGPTTGPFGVELPNPGERLLR